MEVSPWLGAGALALAALRFAYDIYKDHRFRDSSDNRDAKGGPPAAAA